MKNFGIKAVSVVLAVSLLVGGCFTASASALDVEKALTHAGVGALGGIVKGLIGGLCAIVPDSAKTKKLSEKTSENFYSGTETMLDSPASGAQWQLGYAKASLVPDDILDEGTEYYLGGFLTLDNGMNNKIEEVIDDMQVRVIALSDSSDRGVSVFANVDCIGFCNSDIKVVRQYLKDLNLDVDFNSVNISSTHCHSCIDTQGLWTNTFKKIFGNLFKSYIPFAKLERGANEEWLDGVCHIIANSIKAAVEDMTPGTMTYAVKTLNPEYFDNRNRKSSTSLCSDMSRFIFTPDDSGKTPTMLVNINAHPDVVGLATSDPQDNGRQLSGDYVYYLGKRIEEGGYNFMFVNGAIAGIYYGRGLSNDGVDLERRYMQAVRYGTEMGNIALSLTKTYDEISREADWDTINAESEGNEHYTLWFEGWEPVEEREIEPVLNIRLKEIQVPVTNPLIKLVGKLELTSYEIYKDGLSKYYMFSEVGYAEFGDVKIAMVPGELVQDVMYGGGSLTAEGSFSGKDFGLPYIREIFGEDTICFGLCNDAFGYIVPDNDYCLAIADDHYQELISLGDKTASTVVKGLMEIAEEIK